jgi:hypothetical protein
MVQGVLSMPRLIIVVTILLATAAVAGEASRHVAQAEDDAACTPSDSGSDTTVHSFEKAGEGDVLQTLEGVRFDGTAVVDNPPMGAHSGSQGARSQDGLDAFRSAGRPVMMAFAKPQQVVGLYVGREEPGDNGKVAYVRLTGYGTNGFGTTSILASSEIALPPEAVRVNRCLTISAPEGTGFFGAALDYMTSDRRSLPERRWFDDLTLVPAPAGVPFVPPVGVAGGAPIARNTSPGEGGNPPWHWMALAGLGLAIACACAIAGLYTGPTRTPVSATPPSQLQNVETLRTDNGRRSGRRAA